MASHVPGSVIRRTHDLHNYFTDMYSGSEAGSYLRLIDFCTTQLSGMRVIRMKKGEPGLSSALESSWKSNAPSLK